MGVYLGAPGISHAQILPEPDSLRPPIHLVRGAFNASAIDTFCDILRRRLEHWQAHSDYDKERVGDLIEGMKELLLEIHYYKVRQGLPTLTRNQNAWVQFFLGAIQSLSVNIPSMYLSLF